MKQHRHLWFASLLLCVCWSLQPLPAEGQTKYIEVETEATYEAGEEDSKKDAIEKAKTKAEREAVEEIVGVFLESYTEMVDFQTVKDRVQVFTHAHVKVKVLHKEYDCEAGCRAFVKVRVRVARSELVKF